MLKYLPILILAVPQVISAGTLPSISEYVENVESHYNLPKGILRAIIKVESGGKVNIVNPNDGTRLQKLQGKVVKSLGLMQIQLAAAYSVGFRGKAKELLHPMVNIEYGARYLKLMLTSHQNNLAQSLTCWNAGPNSASCLNKKYTPYVGNVLNALYSR